ncbi:MAG: hypothetical protein ACR5LE_17610 [Symbiopectobacterium sp.]
MLIGLQKAVINSERQNTVKSRKKKNQVRNDGYIIPKVEGGEQITYFNHHVCSVITERSEDGKPISHIHLTNGQVIDCALEHHDAVGSIQFYNQ